MLEALVGRTDKEASFHVEAFEKVVAMGLLGVYRKYIARHKVFEYVDFVEEYPMRRAARSRNASCASRPSNATASNPPE